MVTLQGGAGGLVGYGGGVASAGGDCASKCCNCLGCAETDEVTVMMEVSGITTRNTDATVLCADLCDSCVQFNGHFSVGSPTGDSCGSGLACCTVFGESSADCPGPLIGVTSSLELEATFIYNTDSVAHDHTDNCGNVTSVPPDHTLIEATITTITGPALGCTGESVQCYAGLFEGPLGCTFSKVLEPTSGGGSDNEFCDPGHVSPCGCILAGLTLTISGST